MNNKTAEFQFNEEYPKLNKRHARGPGPRRTQLPNYKLLGHFDNDFKEKCFHLIQSVGFETNHIRTDNYNMSKSSPLCMFFPDTYKQVLLQRAATTGLFEEDFSIDLYPDILNKIRLNLNGLEFYRARFSILPPRETLDWHIDTDTSVSCRIHFILSGNSTWEISRRQNIETKVLSHGEIWFTNTGWPHRVKNESDDIRVVLNIGCSYENLQKAVGDFRLQDKQRQ